MSSGAQIHGDSAGAPLPLRTTDSSACELSQHDASLHRDGRARISPRPPSSHVALCRRARHPLCRRDLPTGNSGRPVRPLPRSIHRLLSFISCDDVRCLVLKRIAQTCTQLRVYSLVRASNTSAAIVLEDDHVLTPSVAHVKRLLPHVLGWLRARNDWDIAMLGSCYELLEQIQECSAWLSSSQLCVNAGADAPLLGLPFWISSAKRAICQHGLVATQRGATVLVRELEAWLVRYVKSTATFNFSEPQCSAKFWVRARKFAFDGHDWALRWAILRRSLRALHVWPQLVEQVDSDFKGKLHVFVDYEHKLPPACTACAGQMARYYAPDEGIFANHR